MELRAEGSTAAEAFARIALDLFATAVDPASVVEADVREVRAHGAGLPALLRHWLQECLYVHEVEGFACRSIDFAVFDSAPAAGGEALRLHAFLHGETLDPSRHHIKAVIRNIQEAPARVEAGAHGFTVRAVLEV